jgi:hypothetical protein
LGDLLASRGDTARALAEYLAAEDLSGGDPFTALHVINSGIALRRHSLAIDHAWMAQRRAPDDARPSRWLVQSLLSAGLRDSALVVARAAAIAHESSAAYLDTYVLALEQVGAPSMDLLIGRGSLAWLTGDIVGAAARFDSLAGTPTCLDLSVARLAVLALEAEWARMCSFSYLSVGNSLSEKR